MQNILEEYNDPAIIHIFMITLHTLPILMMGVEAKGMLNDDILKGLEDAIQKQSTNAAVFRQGAERGAAQGNGKKVG